MLNFIQISKLNIVFRLLDLRCFSMSYGLLIESFCINKLNAGKVLMSGLWRQKDVIAHGEKSVTAFITSSLYYWKKLQKKKKKKLFTSTLSMVKEKKLLLKFQAGKKRAKSEWKTKS